MSKKRTKLTKCVIVMLAAAFFAGTIVAAKIEPASKSPVIATPVAAAVQDFAPVKDHTVHIKRLGQEVKEGNALLILNFNKRPETNQFRLTLDDRVMSFRDDGQGGDETAGDGRFTTVISADFGELSANQSRISTLHSRLNAPATFSTFVGRVKVGERLMSLPLSANQLQPGQEVELEPVASALAIDPARSLMITDLRVVEDPRRTYNPCTGVGTPMGVWTFGYLMQEMANQAATGIDPATFTRQWLAHWEANQNINGWGVPPRQSVKDTVIIPWEQASGGPGYPLDLAKAPFRLLAIVNRIDLSGNSGYTTSGAGEARFVFGVIDRRENGGCGCRVSEMTVIFEYGIDFRRCEEVKSWAQQWANLSTLVLGSPAYNAALEAITQQFAKAGVAPHKVNGSALNQLRTNEFLPPVTAPWELREFKLTPGLGDIFPATGQLEMTTVKQTPDEILNGTNTLADYINSDCAGVNAGTHVVPLNFPRSPFDPPLPNPPRMLGGNSFVPPGVWNAPGLACGPNPPGNARFQFSMATCGGCHLNETATAFYHIRPTPFGTPAALSLFLQGPISVNDPTGNGVIRNFNEMLRRAQLLDQLANMDCRIGGIGVFEDISVSKTGEARTVRSSAFIH